MQHVCKNIPIKDTTRIKYIAFLGVFPCIPVSINDGAAVYAITNGVYFSLWPVALICTYNHNVHIIIMKVQLRSI